MSNTKIIYTCLFLVELAVSIVVSLVSYWILKLILPYSEASVATAISTVSGLWFVHVTLRAIQTLQNGVKENERNDVSGLNSTVKEFKSKMSKKETSCSCGSKQNDEDCLPFATNAHSKNLIRQSTERCHSTKISIKILAIFATVILQCAIRLFALLHSINRTFGLKRRSPSNTSPLISFFDIPFTIGKSMSLGGRSFFIFYFLDRWLYQSGGDSPSHSRMMLQAVSFDKISINVAQVIVQKGVHRDASASQKPPRLGLSLGDIQFTLTIHLKQNHKSGQSKSADPTLDQSLRSISIAIRIESLEFGLFPSINRVTTCGIQCDARASFDTNARSSAKLCGAGMALECNQLNKLSSGSLLKSKEHAKIISWDAVQSTFYVCDSGNKFQVASLVSFPAGSVIRAVGNKSPQSQQASVVLGTANHHGDEENICQNCFSLGLGFEPMPAFLLSMNWLIRDVMSSAFVNSSSIGSSEENHHQSTTKLKKRSSVEAVELDASCCFCFYGTYNNVEEEESFYITSTSSTFYWRKSAQPNSDGLLRSDDLGPTTQIQDNEHSCLSPLYIARLADVNLRCFGGTFFNVIRLERMKAKLLLLPTKKSSNSAGEITYDSGSIVKHAVADMGRLVVRLDDDIIKRMAQLNKAVKATISSANHLKTTTNQLNLLLSNNDKKNQPASCVKKSSNAQHAFHVMKLSSECVDAVIELQPPCDDDNNETISDDGCIRIAVLQRKSVVQLSYKDSTKATGFDGQVPENKLPLPDALFGSELHQFEGVFVTEADISRLELSVTFYPHLSLPVIKEHMTNKTETTFYGQLDDLLLKLASPPKAQIVSATVKELSVFELLKNQATASLFSTPVYDYSIRGSIDTGQNDWLMLQEYSRGFSYNLSKILTGTGKFCRVEKKDITLDEKAELMSVQISRGSSELQLYWSPVFQWLQASCNERIQNAIVYFKSSLSSSLSNQAYKCRKTQVRVLVDSNTTATFHTSLGQKTVMHTVIEGGMDMHVSMSKYQTTSTKKGLKPNVLFESGRIFVAFNDITTPTFVLGSLFLKNFTRPATLCEISDYAEKKGMSFHDFDKEIVTNHEGHPMKEIFDLKLAACTAKFHPSLHFGEVIDDFLLTPRSLDIGLDSLKPNLIKQEKKYQLMSIRVSFSFLDMSLLGDASCDHEISPSTINEMLLQDVARAYFESFDVSIERDTPPEVTQSAIAALDEDKTSAHTYGPSIQGGRLHLTIDHAVATLVPLNLAIPLVRINGFDMIGSLFLSSLSPDTPGVGEGRTNDSLLLCHHGLSPLSRRGGRRECGCCYGIATHSSGIPVKVYIDSKLQFRELDSSYGPVMNLSTPRLMECIQRLLPPAPQNPDMETAKPIPLSWWDNVRFFIHGKIALSARALSVRWLLDSQYHLDQSILLTCQTCSIENSLGFFGIDATELTVSIPGTSYDMSVHPSRKSAPKPHYLPHEAECAVGEERHPLVFVPSLSTKITFSWKMLVGTSYTSSDHHSPYVRSQSAEGQSASVDKFEPFRSDGLSANFEFDLPGTELIGNWIVLRIDVLPWFTHINAATSNTPRLNDDHKSESFPKFRSVALKAHVDELKLATWFTGEKELDDWDVDDVVGVCLTVKSLSYTTSGGDKDLVIEGPIKAAANLNVREFIDSLECDEKEDHDMRDVERIGQNFGREDDIDCSSSEDSSTSDDDDELPPFFKLQVLSRNINELDYVVNAGQVDIQNRSLQSILAGSRTQETNDGGSYIADVDNTTWSILVSQLKILWTLEIRDNLMALTQDLLFTIGFMKSQMRQSQLLVEQAASSSPEDNNQSVSLHEATDEGVEMTINLPKSKKSDDTEGESRLEYLLQREVGFGLEISTNGSQENVIAGQSAHSEQREGGINNPTVPTIDIHFSNPQVQLHRKSTGGSIILAMEGAHVEGRKFVRFLVDNHMSNGKVTPSDLTRRTEHAYTLTNMQAYSLSTRVDVTAGLPWLEVCLPGSQSTCTGGESYLEERFGITGHGRQAEAEHHQAQLQECSNNEPHQYIYPPHLRHHEPLAFLKTGLLSPILNQFTFKSRQTFHRPPIHYSNDELLDFIKQGLVTTQDDDVVDEVDLKIDLLHFTLDSSKQLLTSSGTFYWSPPKPRRHRNFGGEETESQTPSNRISSVAAIEMEEILASDNIQRGKHGREKLRSAAMSLLRDLEDMHALGGGSITRRISYRLKKLIWCIHSPNSIDNIDIDFTGFVGLHDYFSDGSVSSQFGLEDVRVSSSKPGPDSIIFSDPTSVIKPVLDERSPCQRCHRRFDHSQNNLNSCSFHAGKFASGIWSCCKSTDRFALGCKSGPHTGKERAAIVRVETLPRVIEGITLYSHFEVNIFPEIPHALIVQISKSLSKLFMSYFFVGAEERADIDDAVSTITDVTGSTEAFSTKTENIPRQKAVLFGGKGSPREKQVENYTPEHSAEVCSRPEIVFIKVWRVGYINVEVTTGGFRRIPQRTIDICVPAYSRAYKIGSWAYLGQKYLMYLVHEVLKSGASSAIFRRKVTGNASDVQSDPAQSLTSEPTASSESGGLPGHETFIGRLRRPVGAEAILGTPLKQTKPNKMKVSSFVRK